MLVKMKAIFKILLVVALITLLGSSQVVCMDIPFAVLDRLGWDSYYLFGADPEEFAALINKYKDEKYYPIFKQILDNSNQYKEDAVYGVILFSAILQDKNHFKSITNLHASGYKYEDVIRFYYYRIGHNKKNNLNYLKKRFDYLVAHPTDSYSIGFLAFVEGVDLPITYLDKLTPKSDGALSELIAWTIGYLYFLNKNNLQAIAQIKQSYTYKIFKREVHLMVFKEDIEKK
jgi:hypothetical protein